MPPLMFNADSPAPAPEPNPEMILLIREVRVEPELVWTGRVEPAAKPAKRGKAGNRTGREKAEKPQQKRHGFFAWVKRLFGGGRKNAPCTGAGCSG